MRIDKFDDIEWKADVFTDIKEKNMAFTNFREYMKTIHGMNLNINTIKIKPDSQLNSITNTFWMDNVGDYIGDPVLKIKINDNNDQLTPSEIFNSITLFIMGSIIIKLDDKIIDIMIKLYNLSPSYNDGYIIPLPLDVFIQKNIMPIWIAYRAGIIVEYELKQQVVNKITDVSLEYTYYTVPNAVIQNNPLKEKTTYEFKNYNSDINILSRQIQSIEEIINRNNTIYCVKLPIVLPTLYIFFYFTDENDIFIQNDFNRVVLFLNNHSFCFTYDDLILTGMHGVYMINLVNDEIQMEKSSWIDTSKISDTKLLIYGLKNDINIKIKAFSVYQNIFNYNYRKGHVNVLFMP